MNSQHAASGILMNTQRVPILEGVGGQGVGGALQGAGTGTGTRKPKTRRGEKNRTNMTEKDKGNRNDRKVMMTIGGKTEVKETSGGKKIESGRRG